MASPYRRSARPWRRPDRHGDGDGTELYLCDGLTADRYGDDHDDRRDRHRRLAGSRHLGAGPPDPGADLGHGPRRSCLSAASTADETEGAYSTAELPAAFPAAGFADAVTLTILEDANPDGRATGTRDNANGVDVNRNFPAKNFDAANPSSGGTALNQPETQAVDHMIERAKPDLVLVAHSWLNRQFINFDGPSRAIAERFSASSGLPVAETSSFAPTPGSLGSYFGRDRGISVLTIELLKGSDPKADCEKIRAALLEAIRG